MPEPIIWRSFNPLVAEEDVSPAIEIRDDGGPKIRGLAAAYGKWSLDLGGFKEIIEPGAFDRVLSRKNLDVVAFFDHDGQPLGRTTSGTLRLAVDERGLNYENDPPDTQLGRDVTTLIRRRDLFGSSFAFTVDPKGETWTHDEKGNTSRTIREFSGLYDVSVVTHAAYGKATSVAVRALEKFRAENLTAAENARLAEQAADKQADYMRSLSGARAAAAAAVARMRAHAG
jgi:HK97 family phage prohead protease